MPDSPLRYVLVYALADDSGLTLIDAGWDNEESWVALNNGLTHIGASIADVQGMLITHHHSDHIGLAHRVRSASGAWIALHPADYEAIIRPEFRDPKIAKIDGLQSLLALGASSSEANDLINRSAKADFRSTYAIPDRLVEDGEVIGVAGWSLRAVHTPGHTPGHLCFIDEDAKLLFAGDHVLPRISPNISADANAQVDALGNFLCSLSKISEYEVDEVLPAHEWRYRGLQQRVKELRDHHEGRLKELLRIVEANPGSVAWELAGELSWSRAWNETLGFVRTSAVRETKAHLVHLQHLGLIDSTSDEVPRYSVNLNAD